MISEIEKCFRFLLSVRLLAIADRSENCVLMIFRTREKMVFPFWAAVVFLCRSLNLGPAQKTGPGLVKNTGK